MNPDSKNLKSKIEKAGLQVPKALTLMITKACNLNCPHCLLDCSTKIPGHAPEKAVFKIVDEFSGLGGETLTVTGGEPLCHPKWFDILQYACNTSGIKKIILQTNGTILKDDGVEKLRKLPPDKLKVQLSIDGATPGINDLIRGEGSFNSSIKALKLLAKAGIEKRINIAFTEMRHNFHEIPGMLKLADRFGVSRFVTGSLVKGGRAGVAEWIDLPGRSQVRELIELYESDIAFRKLYDKLGNISAIEWLKGREIPSDHVCNCISTPFINSDGMMFPCLMFLDDSLSVDSVFEEGLEKGILIGLENWSKLPELDKKRGIYLKKCKDCPGRDHCRGGCIGRAQSVSGDPMSVEDRCEMRREVYFY